MHCTHEVWMHFLRNLPRIYKRGDCNKSGRAGNFQKLNFHYIFNKWGDDYSVLESTYQMCLNPCTFQLLLPSRNNKYRRNESRITLLPQLHHIRNTLLATTVKSPLRSSYHNVWQKSRKLVRMACTNHLIFLMPDELNELTYLEGCGKSTWPKFKARFHIYQLQANLNCECFKNISLQYSF